LTLLTALLVALITKVHTHTCIQGEWEECGFHAGSWYGEALRYKESGNGHFALMRGSRSKSCWFVLSAIELDMPLW